MAVDVTEAATLAAWLDPKIVVPAIGVVLASVIVPILLHILKVKREREDKILEIRTRVYSEYFRKFEEAAKGVGVDYEQFSKVTLRNAFKELLEAGDSPDAIIKFQDEVGRFPHQILEAGVGAEIELTLGTSVPTFSGTSQGMTPAMVIISTAAMPVPVR